MQLDPINRSTPVAENSSMVQQKMAPKPPHYGSTLVSSTDQNFISRLFGMVWGMLISVFETVFFCFNYSGGIFGHSKIDTLKNQRGIFQTLYEEFVKNRDAKGVEDFKSYWIKTFDSLSPEAQERIVKESMVEWALSKAEDVNEYVSKAYANPELKEKALKYVRELIPVSTDDFGWKPTDDSQVPKMLMDIIQQLDAEIASAQA